MHPEVSNNNREQTAWWGKKIKPHVAKRRSGPTQHQHYWPFHSLSAKQCLHSVFSSNISHIWPKQMLKDIPCREGIFPRETLQKNQKPGFIGEIWSHSTPSVCVVLKCRQWGEAKRQLVAFGLMEHIKYFQSDYLDLVGLITLVQHLF